MNDLFTSSKIKIDIQHVPVPMITEFDPMENLDLSLVYLADQPITITSTIDTKTSVHTAVSIGRARKAVNWLIPGFKFRTDTHENIWTYESKKVYKFKNLKSQGYKEYMQYIHQIVDRILQMDEYYKQYEGTVKVHWIDKVNVNWQKLD